MLGLSYNHVNQAMSNLLQVLPLVSNFRLCFCNFKRPKETPPTPEFSHPCRFFPTASRYLRAPKPHVTLHSPMTSHMGF